MSTNITPDLKRQFYKIQAKAGYISSIISHNPDTLQTSLFIEPHGSYCRHMFPYELEINLRVLDAHVNTMNHLAQVYRSFIYYIIIRDKSSMDIVLKDKDYTVFTVDFYDLDKKKLIEKYIRMAYEE